MSTFVLIEPDAFNRGFSDAVDDSRLFRSVANQSGANIQYHNVRRPVRGIQIKNDTYATIQVRNAAGECMALFDAAAAGDTGKGSINSNFLIQQINEQRVEKQQIVVTFGEPYIFFFGEQPRMINVTGILLNTEDFNWRAEWWANYDRYLRGTACVRSRSRVYLAWDDIIVEGYLISASSQEDAENKNFVQFQFQMFLTNYQNISAIGDPNGHWLDKDINLDPSKIESPGGRDYQSKLELVRAANVTSVQLEQGRGSFSLFDVLQNGILNDVAAQVTSLKGQTVEVLQLAGKFISGRYLRIPYGYQGSAAFDAEVQFALASVPGASQIMNGPAGATNPRKLAITAFGSKLIKEFAVTLSSRYLPYPNGVRQPLSANSDEFVARVQSDPTSFPVVNNMYEDQRLQDEEAGDKVAAVFRAYGVNVEPTDELTKILRTAHFGISSISSVKNVLRGMVDATKTLVGDLTVIQ